MITILSTSLSRGRRFLMDLIQIDPSRVDASIMSASNSSSGQSGTILQATTITGVEVFRRAVHYVLTEWPSLNFAIENGMGGGDAKQKRSWMCEHIAETMIVNKDIDLEDYLAQLINQEFDTIVEDGSLEYNVKWIEKFRRDCQQGKAQEVLDSINAAAAKKQSLGNVKIPPPMNTTQESSDDDDDDDDEDDEKGDT